MEEPEKSHSCDAPGCNMFEDGGHLVVHKKKHEMALNLGNGQNYTFVADQTPTPTRFIRNCEELGLFQDLQNENPFEETFRKAVEMGKTGYGALHQVEHLHLGAGSDDTLHTPHVFPYISEDAPGSTSPGRSVISSLPAAKPSTNHDARVIAVALRDGDETAMPEVSPHDVSKSVVRQEADTSQRRRQSRCVGDGAVKQEPEGGAGGAQLLLRMPDGKLVALSGVQTAGAGAGAHQTVLTFAPAHSAPPQAPAATNSVDSLLADVPAKSTAAEACSSSRPCVSLAKQKLKEVLTGVSKNRAKNNGAAHKPLPAKVSIPRRPSSHDILAITDLQPSSTSSARDAEGANPEDDAAERKRKFLERNRAAAMRCREKRRSWVQALERRSRELEATNQQLQSEVSGLRAEVAQLKTLLLAHKDCPVTQALAQGAQVTIVPSQQPAEQVINVTLPVAQATGRVILADAAPPSRIVSPRRRAAHLAPSPRHRAVPEKPPASDGILLPPGHQIFSVAGLQPATTYILAAAPPRAEPLQVIKVNPNGALGNASAAAVDPSASLEGTDAMLTKPNPALLTAGAALETPGAALMDHVNVLKMDVDSDNEVEVVAEIPTGIRPNS
ncbi:cyclic AMP-dependent transcription factor ATF-7-like isoform X2 [Bacillus rossius redtenbacheri]|uniref:cyclic AMP-dependent transcription factor ATF-7-like isoform X2 n=1 Tax=Bacillus rossius redtenbacheri TaxID=93214 RepID=UPI002FDEF53C